MRNRDTEKTQRRPRLKGLERRSSACRRNNPRRKSDRGGVAAGVVRVVREADATDLAGQCSDIDRIDRAITRLDEAVHRSTVLMEKVAAAVEVVNEQSQRLERLMERFDTGERSAEPDPRTASTADRIRRILRAGKPVSRRVLGIRSDD